MGEVRSARFPSKMKIKSVKNSYEVRKINVSRCLQLCKARLKTHTNERETRRDGLTNLASVFSVIPRMIGSSTKRLERLPILWCEPIPRLPKSSDCRRIESGENGEESVVIVQEEETLSIENDISSDPVKYGMAGITHLAEFDKVLDQ